MKTYKLIITTLFFSVTLNTLASSWHQKTSLQSDARVIPNIFVINEKAYLGGGFAAGYLYLNNFWEYNPANDIWTQKADQPQPVGGGAAFSLNSKGYIVTGWINGVQSNGVYEYDPLTNAWTTKNNFPGAPRYGTCNFVIGNKAYVGLGYTPFQADLWEYDPVPDSWSQKANFPGGARSATVHFAINGLGYVGTGINNTATYAGLADFYSYNPNNNTWIQIGNFPGPARHSAVSFVINNKAYMGTGNVGNFAGTTYNDFWEFDPALSSWTQVETLPAGIRQSGGAFAIGNYGYVFDGFYQTSPQTFYNELWQYCNTPPSAVIFPSGATTFCLGGSVLLNANAGSGLLWQWKKNGADIPGATNAGYTATTSGNYRVVVTNACGSATSSPVAVTVLASAPKKPGAIAGPSTFCAYQAGVVYSISAVANASAYNWTVPTGATIMNGQGTTSITVNFSNKSGNIKVSAGNACGFGPYQQKKVTKTCRESGETTADDNEIIVYPNPSVGDFIFEFSNEISEQASITVYDMTGKMIFYENISSTLYTIPHARLSPGIYSAVVIEGKNKKVLRLVKTR